jgi:TRAP-type C4-dicarboxylate transport system substrate-binding protein
MAMARTMAAVLGAFLVGSIAQAGVAFAGESHTLKIATVAPEGTPWAELLKLYKRRVEDGSGGRIKVKVYLGGTMGDEIEAVRKASRGHIQGVGASTGAVAALVPELNVVEIPFMFRSFREADHILDNVLLAPMEALFRERGLVLGFWSENGFRHFGSSWGPVLAPDDLKGRKMRSQESFVHLEMWKAFAAAPQAIPTTEVLTALQTGAVDGFDQGLLFAIAASWHKSVKHVTLSAHIYQPAVIAFNKEWFDALPKDLQKVLLDEGRKIVSQGRKLIRALNPDLIGILEEAGIEIHKLSAEQRAKFEPKAAHVRVRFRDKQGASAVEILDLVEQGLAEFRKSNGK